MPHRERHNGFVEYTYAASNTQLNGRSSVGTIKIPDNYKEAMRLPGAHLWKAVMEKELKRLQELNVYKLVPKSDVPEGQNVIGSKWVIKLKTGQQSLTAMSTMEAELVAGALAMKEAVFYSCLLYTSPSPRD